MRDIHLSREILSAVAKGELPPRTIVQIGIDHLRCLCPTCNSEWSAWEKERRGEGAGSFAERSPLSPEAEQPEVAAEREAARDFRRLGRLAPRERRQRIGRSRSRFRSPALVRLLLAEMRRLLLDDPSSVHHFAELSCRVAEHLSSLKATDGLVPLAVAERVDTLRLLDDHREALAALRLFQQAGAQEA